MQAVSFSQTPRVPSASSMSANLNALQSALTQILSAFMTYILTSRTLDSKANHLGKRHKAWFVLAHLLPVVSFAVTRSMPGLAALLSFVGTAVTGILQVVLVVGERDTKGLP